MKLPDADDGWPSLALWWLAVGTYLSTCTLRGGTSGTRRSGLLQASGVVTLIGPQLPLPSLLPTTEKIGVLTRHFTISDKKNINAKCRCCRKAWKSPSKGVMEKRRSDIKKGLPLYRPPTELAGTFSGADQG